MDRQYIESEAWVQALTENERSLVVLSLGLYDQERKMVLEYGQERVDYSYIVFPIAKAYEGFLKRLLFEWGLIDTSAYEGKRFRIGRALNPDVREDQRDEFWLFDDLSNKCGNDLARQLWDTWIDCRNQVFHYFPKKPIFLTLDQAHKCLKELTEAMEIALVCKKTLRS